MCVLPVEASCPATVQSFHPTATCITSASLSQNWASVKDCAVAQWTAQKSDTKDATKVTGNDVPR